MVPEIIPEVAWFEEQRSLLAEYLDGTPWQTTGDRRLKTMRPSLKKHANKLRQLPGNFLPMAMDQYLASLWQETSPSDSGMGKWPFRAFGILKDLGGGRYWCLDEDNQEFGLYSGNIGKTIDEGNRLFLTVMIPLDRSWCITYGPLFGWHGLFLGDMSYFASKIAPQLNAKKGYSAVIQFDPVPFWAAWCYGNMPAIYHGEEPVIQCWMHGKLDLGFEGALPSTWTRTDVGQKTRWWYRDNNYFRRREVFLDRETGKALVFANRPGDFEKMMRIVGKHFEPEERVPLNASMMVLTIAYDISGCG